MANLRQVHTLPPRKPGEEDATEKQLDYIRHLANYPEGVLASLGKWQASTLIDLLQAERNERDEQRQAPAPKKKGCGCGTLLVVLIGAIWLLVQALKKPSDTKTEELPKPEPVVEIKKPLYDLPPRKPEALPRETLAHTDPVLPPPPDYVTTLANTPLPAKLKTIESVTLLDSIGMPATIPAETLMTVNSRTSGGTLTITIAGKAYVGNEDRIAKKAKLVESATSSPPPTPH